MADPLPYPDFNGDYTGEGGGTERSPERPLIDTEAVFNLADAIDPRYRALILLIAFAPGVHREGVRACRRRHVDLLHARMGTEVQEQDTEGDHVASVPNNESARWITLPAFLVDELSWHLDMYAQPGPEGYVFTSPEGGPLDLAHWHKSFRKARDAVGLPDIHPHDLRHGRGDDPRLAGRDHPGDHGPARPPLPERR